MSGKTHSQKHSKNIQLTLKFSAVTSDGRLTTKGATPSVAWVTLLLGSRSDVSWYSSTVCAVRITGIPPTSWSSESLTCTCLPEQFRHVSNQNNSKMSFFPLHLLQPAYLDGKWNPRLQEKWSSNQIQCVWRDDVFDARKVSFFWKSTYEGAAGTVLMSPEKWCLTSLCATDLLIPSTHSCLHSLASCNWGMLPMCGQEAGASEAYVDSSLSDVPVWVRLQRDRGTWRTMSPFNGGFRFSWMCPNDQGESREPRGWALTGGGN